MHARALVHVSYNYLDNYIDNYIDIIIEIIKAYR